MNIPQIDSLPEDPSALRDIIVSLVTGYHTLTSERDRIQRHADWLQEHIRILLGKRYGRSSEKDVIAQPGLFDEAELESASHPACDDAEEPADRDGDATDGVAVAGHVRQKRGRRPLPEGLPREDIVHDLSDADKTCPHDGHLMVAIGRETSEQIDIVPATVRVIRHVRLKYGCPHCRTGIRIAPMPAQPVPKSIATPGTLAWVAVSKYADALPLHRMEEMISRIGIDIPRATLSHWMIRAGILVQPLINFMRDHLLEQGVIQMDETVVQVLKEPDRPATSNSYMWVQKGGLPESPVILFDYDQSRGGAVPAKLLADFEGWLQTDGYAGYGPAVASLPGVRRVGCWAHARRKFVEAAQAAVGKNGRKDNNASRFVAMIGKLYAVEKRIRGLSPETRHRERNVDVPPLLKELRSRLLEMKPGVPPGSALGRALSYLDDQWPLLVRYIEDGRLEIDNNGAENAIRPFVVGRKNWLFSRSVAGVKASANLYSLIETVKANGLEPYAYLCHAFALLPLYGTADQYDTLMPWNLNPDMTQKVKGTRNGVN